MRFPQIISFRWQNVSHKPLSLKDNILIPEAFHEVLSYFWIQKFIFKPCFFTSFNSKCVSITAEWFFVRSKKHFLSPQIAYPSSAPSRKKHLKAKPKYAFANYFFSKRTTFAVKKRMAICHAVTTSYTYISSLTSTYQVYLSHKLKAKSLIGCQKDILPTRKNHVFSNQSGLDTK